MKTQRVKNKIQFIVKVNCPDCGRLKVLVVRPHRQLYMYFCWGCLEFNEVYFKDFKFPGHFDPTQRMDRESRKSA